MTPNTKVGLGSRLVIGIRSAFRAWMHGDFAQQVNSLLEGTPTLPPTVQAAPTATVPAKPVEPPQPVIDPLQLVAILQREGRLIDFLMEDIQGLPDAQIGAAVREVHQKCAKALKEHVTLEAVVATAEDESMTVAAGYDPSSIRVVGNLGANPPYTGLVRHRGWRAREVQLQPLPSGQNPRIIAPAEIEVA